MYSLFSRSSPAAQGIIRLPDWLYVKSKLELNLQSVVTFYRRNPQAVHSDHFLVKLLQSITIPQSQNLERYYDNVDAISLNLSMALKMTSSIFRGQLFDGIFFGKNTYEVLIAYNDSFNPFEANENWKDLRPVEILRYPRSDLGLNLPSGTHVGSGVNFGIIAINIPLLAIQYRAFRLNEIAVNTDNTLSVMHFIHMYVLPNMLYSQLDHAIFNRIASIEQGVELGEIDKNHPFYLSDYSAKLDRVHLIILDVLRKENKDFNGILRNIPMVSCQDAAELMRIPDMALTRQVLWSLVLARLPELLFLVTLAKESIGNKNQSEVNRIVRYFLNYRSDNLFRQMLPVDLFSIINNDISEIEKLVRS